MKAKRGERAASTKPAHRSVAQSYEVDEPSFKRVATSIIYVSGNCGEQASREFRPVLKHFTRTELEATLVAAVERYLMLWDEGMELVRSIVAAESAQNQAQEHEKKLRDLLQLQIDIAPKATRSKLARSGGHGSAANNPAHLAMVEIEHEFNRWQRHEVRYANDSDFARKMHAKHADKVTSEGSIKNNCTKWRKVRKSSC